MSGFTSEELAIAKSVDLVDVASYLGFTPKKIGQYYTLKEMDSIRIYNRSHWYRWSMAGNKGHDGGSQIDFLKEFAGLDVKGAVFWLLDFAGYRRNDTGHTVIKHRVVEKAAPVKKEFILPEANEDNNRVIAYLNKTRRISISTIEYFINHGLLYEDKEHHNIIFKGNDPDGVTRFASRRGTYDREGEKPFKCDVAGNDKNYGFNITEPKSNVVFVFEGAIDLMSYADMYQKFDVNMIALGMVSDAPLEMFLKDHPDIRFIFFCLDNDEAGRKATANLMAKYYEAGYEVRDVHPPETYKDVNEWLIASRLIVPGHEIGAIKKIL